VITPDGLLISIRGSWEADHCSPTLANIYITASSMFENNIDGLCGNYNGDPRDDRIAPRYFYNKKRNLLRSVFRGQLEQHQRDLEKA